MHTEPDLGIPIDLIDPTSYTIPTVGSLTSKKRLTLS